MTTKCLCCFLRHIFLLTDGSAACPHKRQTAASEDLKIPCLRRTDQFSGTRGMAGMPRKGHAKPHTRAHTHTNSQTTCTVSMQSGDRRTHWTLDSQWSGKETVVVVLGGLPCQTWQKTTSKLCHWGFTAEPYQPYSVTLTRIFFFAHWMVMPVRFSKQKNNNLHFLSPINL